MELRTYTGPLLAVALMIAIVASCQAPREKAERSSPSPVVKVAPPSDLSSTQVVLLGTGTPVPDPDRSGPATAVVAGNRAYLIDFGPGVVRRASAAFFKGIAPLSAQLLTHAFATHLHSDHTAGYSDLILSSAVVGRRSPLQVYGPPGITKMTDHILAAYEEDLSVRAQKHSKDAMRGYRVDAHEIEPGVVYEDANVKVTAFPVRHGTWKHAFGYRFDTPNRSIVISGDTAPAETTIKACNGCDVLVHEVYCQAGFDRGSTDWQKYHDNFHTSTFELAELATKARPKLLVLYHLLFFSCSEEQLLAEIRDRYKGKVVLGNDLDVY